MSSETIEEITVRGDAITVSLLVWRRFRRAMPGLVERVLDINPGLAAVGPLIPPGTTVRVPVPAPQPIRDVTPIRLWSP